MRISVLIPAWNAEAWLSEALQSVEGQTLPPHEVVVIDDGSDDRTAAVARSFPQVRLLSRDTSGGPAAALNDGLRLATGDVVAFLDADDLWPSDNLQSHAAYADFDASLGMVEEFSCPLEPIEMAMTAPRACYQGWLSGATLVRRAALERTGLFNERLSNGFWIDWVDRARLAGVRFGISDHVALRRRIRSNSLSAPSPSRDRDLLEVARRALERRRSTGS